MPKNADGQMDGQTAFQLYIIDTCVKFLSVAQNLAVTLPVHNQSPKFYPQRIFILVYSLSATPKYFRKQSPIVFYRFVLYDNVKNFGKFLLKFYKTNDLRHQCTCTYDYIITCTTGWSDPIEKSP